MNSRGVLSSLVAQAGIEAFVAAFAPKCATNFDASDHFGKDRTLSEQRFR
jgi:hypothetical protein